MRVVSLFSGAGGLDLGFMKAGAEITWANDIFKDAVETYRNNIGSHIFLGDIRNIKINEIQEADIIIGGFPCLGYTIAKGKRRRPDDPNNLLYLEYLRVVKGIKPKAFLIENVAGMIQGDAFKKLFEKMISDFEGCGFTVAYKLLNAADYGVPQKRKRIVIIGIRKETGLIPSFPRPTHSKDIQEECLFGNSSERSQVFRWITLREAIGDLPSNFDVSDPEHVGTSHKVKINGYVGNRKLLWDEPSPTITGRGSRTGGPVIHPHPDLKRRLSAKECKRLQSFPDDFIFTGSISSMYAQIGNAVPPLLAFRIAQQLMLTLKYTPKKFDPQEWKLPWNRKIPQI